MKHLSPLAHFEKPQDSQSLGFRSSFRSRTKPPSIATILPCESRKNFPIVDDRFEVFSSLFIFNVVGNVIAVCCMQMRYLIHHRLLVLYRRYPFSRLQSFSTLSPLRLKWYGVSRRKWKCKFFCWLMDGFFISWWLIIVSLYVRVEVAINNLLDTRGYKRLRLLWEYRTIISLWMLSCGCDGGREAQNLLEKYVLLSASDRSLVGKNFD